MIWIILGFRLPAYAGHAITVDGVTKVSEKKVKTVVILLALFASVLATSAYASGGMAAKTESIAGQKNATVVDVRETIVLPDAERDKILASMRRFLRGTQQIMEGLALNDMKMVAQGARSTSPKPLSKESLKARENCPKGCTELCEAMHGGFDSIAAEAEAGKNTRVILEKLSGTLQKCTVCHESYRFDMRPAVNRLPALEKP